MKARKCFSQGLTYPLINKVLAQLAQEQTKRKVSG